MTIKDQHLITTTSYSQDLKELFKILAQQDSNTSIIWYNITSRGVFLQTLKADSHIACRAHAVPLPCCAAKGLECVFPIWFTQCGCVWFTIAMPRPCHALTMPFFSRPRHSAAIETACGLPAFGFFRLSLGVPRKLLSEAYRSQMQVASMKPNVHHGRGKDYYFSARTRMLV